VGVLVAKADADTQSYVFGFDPNGVLKTMTSGSGQTTASYGIAN